MTGIDTIDDRIEVEPASTADQGEACTDDFQTYRLALAVDRDRLTVPTNCRRTAFRPALSPLMGSGSGSG